METLVVIVNIKANVCSSVGLLGGRLGERGTDRRWGGGCRGISVFSCSQGQSNCRPGAQSEAHYAKPPRLFTTWHTFYIKTERETVRERRGGGR